jgi:hypothetical protein
MGNKIQPDDLYEEAEKIEAIEIDLLIVLSNYLIANALIFQAMCKAIKHQNFH